MHRPFRFGIVLAMVVLVISLRAATPGSAQSGTVIDRAGGDDYGVQVVLTADGAPLPGGMASLTFEATPLMDAPDLLVVWEVPAGVELVGPARESLGPVAAGRTVRSQRQARFLAPGTHKVAVGAAYQPNAAAQFAASGVLFFDVGPGGSRVSTRNPHARQPGDTVFLTDVTVSPLAAGPHAPTGDPCFDVSGRIVRTDRMPRQTGLDPAADVPVQNVRVEIRESDTIADDNYGTVLINSDGTFAFPRFCDDDGVFDDELELYIRVWAEVYSGDFLVAEVVDGSAFDPTWEFISNIREHDESATLVFNLASTETQSAIFNILDSGFAAWSFWNASGGDVDGDRTFDDETEFEWAPDNDASGSNYQWWVGTEDITIADEPSDPDEWDDSVIIHEWNHFADDLYSCDDNPGGPHALGSLLDTELAWGEGYGDYYQSAVRSSRGFPDSQFYIENQGTTGLNFWVDLENQVDNNGNALNVSVQDEMAVAGALWDLFDSANENQDATSLGHDEIQFVYTEDTFESNGDVVDDDCDFPTFLNAWVETGQPTDAGTAGAVEQNTGVGSFPDSAMALAVARPEAPSVVSEASRYKWWNQMHFIVDTSPSMGSKLPAVKTVLQEQVNKLGDETFFPDGSEFALYTFNHEPPGVLNTIFEGQFKEELIQDEINSLGEVGPPGEPCQVEALNALYDAVAQDYDVDAWLFTDGPTNTTAPSVENVRQLLVDRRTRASFALLGMCVAAAQASGETTVQAAGAARMEGAARSMLGIEAETPGGVVPYLLTALASGGQFLFVSESQIEDAADILLAQITHSAGAGKWSDYVSDLATYRYDKLTDWEYEWLYFPPDASGWTSLGRPMSGSYVQADFPSPFPYFDWTSSGARVYEGGYLTFNSFGATTNHSANSPIPNPVDPNNAIYPYWDEALDESFCPSLALSPAQACDRGSIYSRQDGDWITIRYRGYEVGYQGPDIDFEVRLNLATGEIRYQYQNLPDSGAAGATIGLEDTSGTRGVQVSYNTGAGAQEGEGYKFIPAPPQPTRTFTVSVDSLMDGVGFLLTGYSGAFEKLLVKDPAGNTIDCASETGEVLCLELGLVQYVQVDVRGRTGVWTATVDAAGSPGEGTFSFTSFATGALSVESRGDHTPSSGDLTRFVLDLGQPVDELVGFFRHPNGDPFGGAFDLYDDGMHSDEDPGDGIFGSDALPPPGEGSAYLSVQGRLGGVQFVRNDPVLYTFQPVSIEPFGLAELSNYGGATEVQFIVTNSDDFPHCYTVDVQEAPGWFSTAPGQICVGGPGVEVLTFDVVRFTFPPGSPNAIPSGVEAIFNVAVSEVEEGIMSDSASVTVTRRRPPASIHFDAPEQMRPGDTVPLEVVVLDEQNVPVADGTEVSFTASTGTVSPTVGTTTDGLVQVTYTAPASEGVAVVGATAADPVAAAGVMAPASASASVEIEIERPGPSELRLSAGTTSLPADGEATTTLVVTVRDEYGEPVRNLPVRIGVEGDEPLIGTVDGAEVVTKTTNANGRVSATFRVGTIAGIAGVHAEAGEARVVEVPGEGTLGLVTGLHEDRVAIEVGVPPGHKLYLPAIGRD